jgi:hypothetical protein
MLIYTLFRVSVTLSQMKISECGNKGEFCAVFFSWCRFGEKAVNPFKILTAWGVRPPEAFV